MNKTQALALTAIIFAAALTRLLPHPPNVAPIAAMALFGGAYARHKAFAFLVPVAAMFASDCIIGFHGGMFVVYLGMLLITGIGLTLRARRTPLKIAAASVASSLVFFAVTNFVWLHNAHQLYDYSLQGMLESYLAALPFLRNTLLGDLFFTALLFGGYAWLARRLPALRMA